MVPDNYLEYINIENVIAQTTLYRNYFIKFARANLYTSTFLISSFNDGISKLNNHFPILENDIKIVCDKVAQYEAKIKQYMRDIAILKGEEIPVDKIEQYEAEEKAKVEAEEKAKVEAEQKKNNTTIGIIVLAIVVFIIYFLKKKQK